MDARKLKFESSIKKKPLNLLTDELFETYIKVCLV